MPKHSLGIRIYNINRIASYAYRYYEMYRILGAQENFPNVNTWTRYYDYWVSTKKVLFEGTINNCDMIMDSHKRGHNILSLLDEIIALGDNPGIQLAEFKSEIIDEAKPIAKRVAIIRNNVFAHRSQDMNYKESMDLANLNDDELGKLVSIYLRITDELNVKIAQKRPWSTVTSKSKDMLLSLINNLSEQEE